MHGTVFLAAACSKFCIVGTTIMAAVVSIAVFIMFRYMISLFIDDLSAIDCIKREHICRTDAVSSILAGLLTFVFIILVFCCCRGPHCHDCPNRVSSPAAHRAEYEELTAADDYELFTTVYGRKFEWFGEYVAKHRQNGDGQTEKVSNMAIDALMRIEFLRYCDNKSEYVPRDGLKLANDAEKMLIECLRNVQTISVARKDAIKLEYATTVYCKCGKKHPKQITDSVILTFSE